MAKIEENDIAFRIEEGENAIDISMWEERSGFGSIYFSVF